MNVLITGGSGYLSGSLLHRLRNNSDILSKSKIFGLIRNEEQAHLIQKHYPATALTLNLDSEAEISQTLLRHKISIFFLIDSGKADIQIRLINGLAKVQQKTGLTTHLLHTSGAKMFSNVPD